MKQIMPNELENQLKNDTSLNIIDVREVEEVQHGKIPTAENIPLGLLEFRMHELDKKKEYILVCRSGSRSMMAARFLENQGYKVVNMYGGMMAWDGPVA